MQRASENQPARKKYLKFGIVFAAVAAILVLIILALKGKTTTSGSFPAAIKTESLLCEAKNIPYKKLRTDTSSSSVTRVTAVFGSPGELTRLSISYTLTHDSVDAAKTSDTNLRIIFAENLSLDGLSYFAFDNKFTHYENQNTLSLFADAKTITEVTAAYFFLDSITPLPKTISEFRNAYEQQGFACTATENQ